MADRKRSWRRKWLGWTVDALGGNGSEGQSKMVFVVEFFFQFQALINAGTVELYIKRARSQIFPRGTAGLVEAETE